LTIHKQPIGGREREGDSRTFVVFAGSLVQIGSTEEVLICDGWSFPESV